MEALALGLVLLLDRAAEGVVEGPRQRVERDRPVPLLDGTVQVSGLDTLRRPNASIPVEPFDGDTIPHADDSFDAVLFADVLHHSTDPRRLLAEGARVARRRLLIKDHTLQGPASERVLRFMDDVGNRRFGVALPYNYWTEQRWREAFEALDLSVETWISKLHLYPVPMDWVFGRSLHFVASLAIAGTQEP